MIPLVEQVPMIAFVSEVPTTFICLGRSHALIIHALIRLVVYASLFPTRVGPPVTLMAVA